MAENHFHVKLGTNEAVQLTIIWGNTPEAVADITLNNIGYQNSAYLSYKVETIDEANPKVLLPASAASGDIYYRIIAVDRAQNKTLSPVYNFGNNNIANVGLEYTGLEKYWNYKTFNLGKAGTASVNVNNGNLTVSATDFSLPGRGLPLAMSRYYNSFSGYSGIFGKGWRSSFEIQLKTNGQDVTICDPDGSIHTHVFGSGSAYIRPPGDYRTVIKNPDGSYQVIYKDGTIYSFGIPQNQIAKLQSIKDRFDNTLTLTYLNGLLDAVTEPSGAKAKFTYLPGLPIVKRIDFTPLEPGSNSRFIEYTYLNGYLTGVYYPYWDSYYITGVKYGYTSSGLLTSSLVSLFHTASRDVEFDPQNNRRNITTFGYKSRSRSLDYISWIFDSYTVNFGAKTTYNAKYTFNYNGTTTTVTDPKNYVYTYIHDNNGLCTSAQSPLCAMHPSYPYQSNWPVMYSYDGQYNLTAVFQMKRVYNGVDDNCLYVKTKYKYNSDGNVTNIIQDSGTGTKNLETVITYVYPPKRHVTTDIASIKEPLGNLTTYTNEYDATGKLYKLTITPQDDTGTNPDNYSIVHQFNQYGLRTSKDVVLKGATASKYHFGYTWYANGLLEKLQNHFGFTTYYYTVYGELKETLDANGVSTKYGVDPATGCLMSVSAPTGPSGFSAYNQLQGYRSHYTYDVNGNKTAEYNARDQQTGYAYDAQNNLYRVTSPDQLYHSYSRYDINGNLIQTSDYNNKYTSYEYDELNRRRKIIDGAGKVEEELVYDESGRVKVRWDGNRNKTEYYYDSVDNLIYVKNFEKEVYKNSSIYSFDKNGNLTEQQLPISSKEESGKIITKISEIDAKNRPKRIEITGWNSNGTSNPNYNQTVNYTYQAGQLKTMGVSIRGGSVQTYTYDYDEAQRLKSLINPSGQKTVFEYFPGGQRKFKYIYKQSGDTSKFITAGYNYDTAYRLTNLNYSWGGYYVNMGYGYNELDKITSNPIQYKVNAPSVVDYLLAQLPPNKGDYKRPTPSTTLTSGSNPVTNSYQYDALGRMTYSEVYGINPGLKWGTYPDIYQKYQKTEFWGIDASGNPGNKRIETAVDIGTKIITESMTYDPAGTNRLNRREVSAPPNSYTVYPYNYDDNGNLTVENYSDSRPDGTFEYGLDSQMLKSFSQTKQEQKPKSTGEYVACFNRTTRTYTYELGGKLLRVKTDIVENTDPDDQWSRNYNDYFYYTHDGVIAEKHEDTGVLKSFTRLGRELISCNDNGNTNFYIQNLRGDVIMLLKDTGEVISVRDYDATGSMISKAPDERTDRDPFGFTGGLDAGRGLWKLGARFYDSSKSSFIQQDRYMGDPSDPLSLNRYVYCNMDPVNFVDPTGFHPAAAFLAFGLGAAIGCAVTDPESSAGELFTNASVGALTALGLYEMAGALQLARANRSLEKAASSWGSKEKLVGHFEKHGAEFSAKSAQEYSTMATDFYQNRTNYLTKVDESGVTRVYDPVTNTFGAYNPDGTARTFFKPTSSTYFDRQPGQ